MRTISIPLLVSCGSTLGPDWKVSIHIEGKHLNFPSYEPSVDLISAKASRPVVPAVEPWINIRPLKPREDESSATRHVHVRLGLSYWPLVRPSLEPELEMALAKESADRAA
jgi:hypothetical protein